MTTPVPTKPGPASERIPAPASRLRIWPEFLRSVAWLGVGLTAGLAIEDWALSILVTLAGVVLVIRLTWKPSDAD